MVGVNEMRRPSPKDLIKTGAQFAYPFYWKRWEVIKIFSIQFNYKIGVEIGIDKGTLEVKRDRLKYYAVDDKMSKWTKKVNETPDINLILDTSENASKEFKDESVDFVFINECKPSDLECWSSKIHEDGLLMGCNYNWGDVAKTVGEYFKEVWILPDNVWAGSKVWIR